MNRFSFAKKNVYWAGMANVLKVFVSFINRSVFIHFLSITLLGINGLYSNILGVLSISELGISAAMDFALYKPVAENDTVKIRSLMTLYRKAYMVIAAVVAIFGLLFVPFLQYLIKDYETMDISVLQLRAYYLIFLFNMVSTYFVSYKYSLIKAQQKDYIIYGFDISGKLVTSVIQIIVLALFKNFFLYLVIQGAVGIIWKLATAFYINRKTTFLKSEKPIPVDDCTKQQIKRNVISLIFIRFGTIAITQTQNIIISVFISVKLVGYVSNYLWVLEGLSGFAEILLNSVISTIGNYAVTESKEKLLKIFDVYTFVGFWIHGFINVCFLAMIQPFITLWIGADNLINLKSVLLITVSWYLLGQRSVITSFRNAVGAFENDKMPSVIQAIVNLATALVFVQFWGLNGVFAGAVISELVSFVLRPTIMYRTLFNEKVSLYYRNQLKYGIVLVFCTIVLSASFSFVKPSYMGFLSTGFAGAVFVNLVFACIFYRNSSFQFLLNKLKAGK